MFNLYNIINTLNDHHGFVVASLIVMGLSVNFVVYLSDNYNNEG